MATDSVTNTVRDDASDLINHFKLDATHSPDHTLQISWERSPVPGSRKIKVETRWYRGDNIGHGAFGAVWVERNNSDASASTVSRAVKEVSKAYMKSRGIDVRRELLALAILSKHPDEFVQFLGWFEDKSILYLTMEYMPLGDLASFVEKGIPEQEVKVITLQLLEGLSLMHKHSLAHRDLKPANIFVKSASPQWLVKIGDFGIAKRCRGDSTALQTEVGTQGYLAPEIAVESNEQYTNACDIWSLGCVVYKALTQKLPFPKYRDLDAFCSGRSFPVGPLSSKNISFSGVSFLEKLLAVDPITRLTAELALECDWLMVSECPPQSAADFENQEEKSTVNTLDVRAVPEYSPQSSADFEYQEEKSTANTLIARVVPEYPQEFGKQEENRVRGIGAVPEYSPQSAADFEKKWNAFRGLCYHMHDIANKGVSGSYHDIYFSNDSDDSKYLRQRVQHEHSVFSKEMNTKGGGIEGLASEGHQEINYPIELLERVTGDGLLAGQMPDFTLLFLEHSEPWFNLAVRHVERCFEHCVKFLRGVLVAVLTEDFRISPALLFHRYLLKPLVHLHSQALYELEQLEKDRTRRSNTKSEFLLDRIPENKGPNVEMRTLMLDFAASQRNYAEGIIEQMLIYYNAEQARFIDNVGRQVVERYLVYPLAKLFRGATMMSRAEFYALYNESEREELDKGMEKLEKWQSLFDGSSDGYQKTEG